MNHKERILGVMKGKEVDYSPIALSANALSKKQREDYSFNFPWGEAASLDEIAEYITQTLDIGYMVNFGLDYLKLENSKIYKENNHIRKEISTTAGIISADIIDLDKWPFGDDIPLNSDFTSHFTKPWLSNHRDLDCLEALYKESMDSVDLTKIKESFMPVKSIADKYNLPVMAHIGMGLTMGLQMFLPTELCFLVMDEPDLVKRFIAIEHKKNLFDIEISKELGVDIVRRNGFYETCEFYSPEMLKEFLFDSLQQEADSINEGGLASAYTISGGYMPILDYLNELNFDSIFHINFAMPGGDIKKVAKELTTKSILTGPDGATEMWCDNDDVIREAVRSVYSNFTSGRVIMSPVPSVHSIMPWKNVLTMIDEWNKFKS